MIFKLDPVTVSSCWKPSFNLQCHQRYFWRLKGFNANDYEIDSMCLALIFYSLPHLFPFYFDIKSFCLSTYRFKSQGGMMCSIPVHMICQSPCALFALPIQSIIIFYYFYSRNCQLDVGAPLDLLPKLSPSNQYQPHIICSFLQINNHLTKP